MYEETTGVNDAVVEEIPEQVAAEQDNDVVTIADLLDNSNEDAAVEEKGEQQQEDAPKAEEGDADPKKTVEQAQQLVSERENNAFAKRLAAEKKKFESNPAYVLGMEYAAKYGGDATAALKAMREQQVEEFAKDPAALAKFVIEQRTPVPVPEPDPEPENETPQQRAGRIANDIRNVLGDKADLKAYMAIDPDFMQNCDNYGAATAVAMMAQKATAQNQTAAKLEQNRRLPQPIRPSGNAQPKAVDFTTMSQKEWEAFEEKAKKARMDGKRIMI